MNYTIRLALNGLAPDSTIGNVPRISALLAVAEVATGPSLSVMDMARLFPRDLLLSLREEPSPAVFLQLHLPAFLTGWVHKAGSDRIHTSLANDGAEKRHGVADSSHHRHSRSTPTTARTTAKSASLP